MDKKPTMIKDVDFKANQNLFAEWFVDFYKYNKFQNFYDIKKYPRIETPENKYKVETEIKKQKKNDWASLLMAKRLFFDLFNSDLEISLKDLFQSRKERIENKRDSQNGDPNKNYIWNMKTNLVLNGNISIPEVKLKDINDFRKYETDNRVKAFLSYNEIGNWMAYLPQNWKIDYDDTPLPINVIQIQLEQYEKFRQHAIFKTFQAIEKAIYENTENKELLLKNGFSNFYNYIVNGLAKDKNPTFKILKANSDFTKLDFSKLDECEPYEKQLILLIAIRNKFAHNQLPEKQLFELGQQFLEKSPNISYAEYYFNLLEKLKLVILNENR